MFCTTAIRLFQKCFSRICFLFLSRNQNISFYYFAVEHFEFEDLVENRKLRIFPRFESIGLRPS